jgi:phosphoribosylpyrophosphate synthetase
MAVRQPAAAVRLTHRPLSVCLRQDAKRVRLRHRPLSVCLRQGAKHVSAYVTHGVFPNESWRRFQKEGGNGAAEGFKYFWITDSCYNTVRGINGTAPFEILSLAEPIAAALQI